MKLGSLCTGILGLDLAVAEHFGAELIWYSEIEAAPITVIEREHPGVPNLGDLKMINWADVPSVDVLTAGYPCQPFSHAGDRKGQADERHLWPYIAEAVRVLRPRWVVLENVAGHLTLGFGDVLGDLAESGFDAEWCLLRASDVGACHRRARLFVVAGGSTATDSHGHGLSQWPQHDREADRQEGHHFVGVDADGRVLWGNYAEAIARWAAVLGRPAPVPVNDAGRLNPPFVEWMMGYPDGWVAHLPRTAALKALGNAVVPQQALAALRELAPDIRAEQAA